MGKYKIEFETPNLPKSQNQLLRRHWTYVRKEKNLWHNIVKGLVAKHGGAPSVPLKHAKVKCIRYSSRCLDYDNLVSCFKFAVDGLVAAGVIKDDSMKTIGMPDFNWVKSTRAEAKIKIVVVEL